MPWPSCKGRNLPLFAKRVSWHHVTSVLGFADGGRKKGERQETDSSGDIWKCNRRCESSGKPSGRGHVSPVGQAHPPAGLLMKSDYPYIFTHSAIFTGIVNSSLSRLLSLSLAHTGHPVMLTQVRRTCLLFAYASPVNRVLSYHISLHVSQFTNKLAGDKMKACLSNGRICVSCQLEHTHTHPSLFFGNTVLVQILVCFLREGD